MSQYQAVDRVIDLLDPEKNALFNSTTEQARALLAEGDVEAIRRLGGPAQEVAGVGVLVVASLGLLVNLGSAVVLARAGGIGHSHSHRAGADHAEDGHAGDGHADCEVALGERWHLARVGRLRVFGLEGPHRDRGGRDG